jgi:hypothetical protein
MAFADKSRKKLRQATSAVRESLAGTVETAKEKVSSTRSGDDNLGPDRGTMDQLEAREERARKEARQEAAKEARQERLEEVRQQEKEQTKEEKLQELRREDMSTLERLGEALTVDYDGDGESLAGEVGLQTEEATRQDNQQTARAIANTRRGVINNRSAIEQVRDDMQQAHSRDQRDFEPMGPPEAPETEPAGPPPMDPGPGMVPTPEEFREQAETPASGGGFGSGQSDDDRRQF